MPTLDPARFPPEPPGPYGEGLTLGDLIHPQLRLPLSPSACEVCDRVAPLRQHPCRFEKGCSCWRNLPCAGTGRVNR